MMLEQTYINVGFYKKWIAFFIPLCISLSSEEVNLVWSYYQKELSFIHIYLKTTFLQQNNVLKNTTHIASVFSGMYIQWTTFLGKGKDKQSTSSQTLYCLYYFSKI